MSRPRLLPWILSAALAVGLLLGACTPPPTPEPTAGPIVVTDGLDRQVTLAEPATRIVSLAPSNTEILYAIGAGGTVVGVDPFSDYPAEAQTNATVITTYPNVSTEAVVALEPDLVLAASVTNPDDVAALEALGLTVYAVGLPATVEDIFAHITTIGELTGKTAEAEVVVTAMQQRLDALTAKLEGASQLTVFYEIDDSEPGKPWTAGPGSFTDVLITLAGGQNLGSTGTEQYFQMSVESIIEGDPDVIIFSHAGYSGRTRDEVLARPGWENVSAIWKGNVFSIDANLVDRPGPRILGGLEALAEMIHPELFA